VGQGNAESPGSGGASPYLPNRARYGNRSKGKRVGVGRIGVRAFGRSLTLALNIVLVIVLVLVIGPRSWTHTPIRPYEHADTLPPRPHVLPPPIRSAGADTCFLLPRNQMHIGRFDQCEDMVVLFEGQFFTRLAGQQSGERESAIELDPPDRSFADQGFHDSWKPVSGAG
jgi:hypothetical protein